MSAGHTPGPWDTADFGDYGDFGGKSVIILGDDRRIAAVHAGGHNADENLSNARLIAAAPDLLEALGEVFFTLTYIHETSDDQQTAASAHEAASKVETAIAKARGEG